MTDKAEILPHNDAHEALDGANMTSDGDRTARVQVWLIVSGFVMMFLASLLMWLRFGPSMFVDLATAVANCF